MLDVATVKLDQSPVEFMVLFDAKALIKHFISSGGAGGSAKALECDLAVPVK